MIYRTNLSREVCKALLDGGKGCKVPSIRSTRLERDGDNIAIIYHQTEVVTFVRDDCIILDSGGYDTVTTKNRMNAALHDTPLRVWQDRGKWAVYRNGEKFMPYSDGMVIGRYHVVGIHNGEEYTVIDCSQYTDALGCATVDYVMGECEDWRVEDLFTGDVETHSGDIIAEELGE